MTDSHTTQPALAPRKDLRPILRRAQNHWRTFNRTGLLFAVELRQLQEGSAHVVYGYDEFGEFAEAEFSDLSAANARKWSRMGAILLSLQRHGRFIVGEAERLPVGSTAVRQLASVEGNFGESAMLSVYDRAIERRPSGRALSDVHIRAAQRAVLTPPEPVDEGDDHTHESPVAKRYEPEEEELLGSDAVVETIQQYVSDLDRDLLGEWEGALSPEDQEDARLALEALRLRIERLAERLGVDEGPSEMPFVK